MRRGPPIFPRTATLFPYTTLFRSRRPSRGRLGDVAYDGGGARVLRGGHGARARDPPRPDRRGASLEDPGRARHLDARELRRLPPRGPDARAGERRPGPARSEEHTSELQSLMRNTYAVFCLIK